MLNVLKKSNSRRIIQDGYSFLLVSHTSELQNEELAYLDGFIIDTDTLTNANDIIYSIRTHKNIQVSLSPLFVNSIYKLPKEVAIHTDGDVELNMLSSYIQRVITIKKRIKNLTVPKAISHEKLIQLKTMAFSYSRNKVLTPITSRESYIGYEFPFISLFYKKNEATSLLRNLEKAVKENSLSVSLEDYVHLCKSCSGNYLNFRECCPKCDSIDIIANDMVHHFVCAHVAPEKDFKVDDGLACPKCDKNLRHIGIDYDKPSSIYSCNTCNHEFQNANMKALCLDCETENKLDELLEKTIGSYTITEIGEQILFNQESTNQPQSETISVGSMNTSLFKIIVNQEIKRIEVTQGDSYLTKITFENKQLELLNIDLKLNLTKEISSIIQSYLKASDILSAEKFNSYYILLPETKENQLERLENIQYNLSKLLSDNLSDTQQEIRIEIHKILGTDNSNTYFE